VPTRPGSGSSTTSSGRVSYSGGGPVGGREAIAMAGAEAGVAADAYADGQLQPDEMPVAPPVEQRRVDENQQIGRNDPCWCGSGKKFKKCHGA
jgi:preprotein translocase subunit SecA